MVTMNKEQATQQLRALIEDYEEIPLPVVWEPFKNISDDQNVLEYLQRDNTNLCQGKKEDFDLLAGKAREYYTGKWAETLLLVLGVRVK